MESFKISSKITKVAIESKPASSPVKNRLSAERPKDVECDIHTLMADGRPHIVLVGMLKGTPYELFVTHDYDVDFKKHKTGILRKVKKGQYDLILTNGEESTAISDVTKVFDADYGTLSRLISMGLRHNIPVEFIVDQLSKDKNFVGFERAVSRVLKKYIKEGEAVRTSANCPECSSDLVFSSGCKTCPSCGWSKCD